LLLIKSGGVHHSAQESSGHGSGSSSQPRRQWSAVVPPITGALSPASVVPNMLAPGVETACTEARVVYEQEYEQEMDAHNNERLEGRVVEVRERLEAYETLLNEAGCCS
jgi:hypothetical protein